MRLSWLMLKCYSSNCGENLRNLYEKYVTISSTVFDGLVVQNAYVKLNGELALFEFNTPKCACRAL
jgi:hypothetical protein